MQSNTTKKAVLVVALVLGLLTSLLVYKYIKNMEAKQNELRADVVVAVQDIEPRTIIDVRMLVIKNLPQSEIPADAFTKIEDVAGKVAMVHLSRDTAISQSNIDVKGLELGLSYTIPPNMRAATIGITPVTGVAGFPKAGDHVDVIATFERQDYTVAKTVIQNVQLLALGSKLQDESMSKEGRKPEITPNDTATLLVTPRQAEILALSEAKGKLRLVLRSAGDQTMVNNSGATMNNESSIAPETQKPSQSILVSNRPVNVTKQPAPPKIKPQTSIEVISGKEITRVIVKGNTKNK